MFMGVVAIKEHGLHPEGIKIIGGQFEQLLNGTDTGTAMSHNAMQLCLYTPHFRLAAVVSDQAVNGKQGL